MKALNLSTCFCFILFAPFIIACTSEPDNIAISPDGVEISFEQEGNGRPAIIFVHGWSNPRSIWDGQVSHFSQKYKAVAIDLPGSGESGNNRTAWTMAAFGKDVASVIHRLELTEVVLVGFSMGTAVVIEAANMIPEKVVGVVLVEDLMDPEMKYPPEAVAQMERVMMDLVTNMTNEKLVQGGFYKRNHEANFERIFPMYNGVSRTGWNESLLNYFKWINESCTGSLQKLQAPVTAINSDMVPTDTEAFRKLAPSFQAKIMTGVGHLVFWDNPEEFNRLLEESIQEFLKNNG